MVVCRSARVMSGIGAADQDGPLPSRISPPTIH
jgi:hypothetical protein